MIHRVNYCQPPEGTIDFIADRSHFKQGKLSPGLHLPVEPAESLLQKMPDFALLLAWNFANEIIGQQDEYVKGGGRFIVPVPEAHIVSGE